MKGELFFFIIISLVCVASCRSFTPIHHHHAAAAGVFVDIIGGGANERLASRETSMTMKDLDQGRRRGGERIVKEEEEEEKLKVGSSPPSCIKKCFGCVPCEAIQVPTTTKPPHVGVQYANYEPEGWKCKCGPTFYTP